MTTTESDSQPVSRVQGWRFSQALVACLLAATVATSWDLHRSFGFDSGLLNGPFLWALLGFNACLCFLLAPFLTVADWLSTRRGRSSRWGQVLLVLPILYWLTQASLQGGWARQFDVAGLGVYGLVALESLLLFGLLKVWTNFSQRWGPVLCFFILAGLALACHEIDRRVYVGLYPVQHAVVGLLSLFLMATSILRLLPFRWPPWLGFVLFALVAAIGGTHLWTFYEGPMAVRRFIAGNKGLVTTRTIRPWLPYHRSEQSNLIAAEFSASFRDWRDRSEQAREAFAQLSPSGPLDVIVISIDAVGSRHTSLQGRDKNTTPFLRDFARECFDFERARSSSTASFFSLTAMLSGAYPSTVSLLRGKDPEYLGEVLGRAGYRSFGYYTDAIFTARPPQWTPPDQRLGFENFRLSTELASELLPMLLDIVKTQTKPFFLFTHLMDPHSPYEVHEGFDFGMDPQARYYSELAHTDQQLKVFIEGLRDIGRLERSIIVITSDHGEAFGEHGSLLHGGVPYSEQCEVPLLIRMPQIEGGQRFSGPVSQTALAPTLIDMLGLPPLRDSEARSLLPIIMGMAEPEDVFAVVERPTLFDAATWPSVTALERGRFKIIHDHDAGVVQLFDLLDDPLEHQDLADKNTEELNELLALEREWRSDRRLLRARRSDLPLELLRWRERIREGDVEAAAELEPFLYSEEPSLRMEAALGFHDAILAGSTTIDSLQKAAFKTNDGILLALVDILKSAEERRPWRAATDLLNSPDLRLRRRATSSLWRMREESFTASIARERLALETDQETCADLMGVILANDPSAEEIVKAIEILGTLEGDVVGRLAFSILSLKDDLIGIHYERLVRHEDNRIMMSVLESLGACDTERRRTTMERFLRLSNVTLRRIAIRGLRNFPPSKWKHDLLVNLVRREPHDEMRILAGIQANEFKDEEVSQAFLDALALYPVTGLGFGHLLVTERPTALANWDLVETQAETDLVVGADLQLKVDLKGPFSRRPRRLLMSTLRRPGLDPEDDFIRVYDQNDDLLFEHKHVDLAVMYYLDLKIPEKVQDELRLRIQFSSEQRPVGEKFGQFFATLILAQDIASVWPPNQEDFRDVAILARFSPDWECRVNDLDHVFLTADQGQLRMIGNQVGATTLIMELRGGVADCELDLLLNEKFLRRISLKANEEQKIRIDDLKGSYDRAHVNRLSFSCQGWQRPQTDRLTPEWRLGLKKVVWQ